MAPIGVFNSRNNPPPGFFRDLSPRPGGGSPSSPQPNHQDPVLLHHVAHVSRIKLDDLFRSRKDSGLLKHVLIQNLSRSYEELVPEITTEEREDGYDEVMIQRRTAEEMWLNACLQDLDDDDDDEMEDQDDDDDSIYSSDSQYDRSPSYFGDSSAEDISPASSPPALSPDMSSMDDLEDDDESMSSLSAALPGPPGQFIDASSHDDHTAFIKFRKREELAAFQRIQYLQTRHEGWADAAGWIF